jgi:hypothetical protein
MRVGRIFVAALAASASLIGAPAVAADREPLIVTRMADPDPDFAARGTAVRRHDASIDRDERIDEAMQNLGRIIGEAASIERQQIEARCRQGMSETATVEQRFAFAANCRYSRR